MKILVADDDLHIRDILIQILNTDEHQVDVVCEGKAAYALMREIQYDVVFLDLNMPRLTGDEVISMSDMWNLNNNIVVITADESRLRNLSNDGSIVAVLEKPFSIGDVNDVLDRISSSSRMEGKDE